MELQEEEFQFHPTDSELLTFLLRFITEKDLCDNGFITVCDIYKQEPWVTYGYGRHCGGEDDGDTSIFRYFISPRYQKEESDRFCKVVGENLGTWREQDKEEKVLSDQNKAVIMGFKKSLSYDTNKSCPGDGKWHMKEYTFSEATLRKFRNSKYRNYVICAIKRKSKGKSSNGSRRSNVSTIVMDFSDEQKVDTKVTLRVNSVDQPRMDQDYKANTPINIVELMVRIQEASSSEENHRLGLSTSSQIQESRIAELLENNGPEIRNIWNEDYGMINHPINPAMEVDDVEVQSKEASGEGNGVLEFDQYTMPQNNLPKEPAHLQQGCSLGVNEDRIAYWELQANNTSFVGLLSGCWDSAIRNNQVQVQEAPGEENGQLELNTSSQIQQPVIPGFANVKSNINMPELYDNLAEYTAVAVLMNLDDELINPFDFYKQAIVESIQHQVQTQEADGEENDLLRLTAPFSQMQEFLMPENNVPEMFYTGDTLLEKSKTQNQPTPQEESETLCKTEETSFASVLAEALLDDAPLKDRLDEVRESNSTLLLDQQSWQSEAHLQDMLL